MKQRELVKNTAMLPFWVSLVILSVLLLFSILSETVSIVDDTTGKIEQTR